MKQIFTSLLSFSLLAITVVSCSKESHNETRHQTTVPQVISATVPAGQTYVLNLGAGSSASIQTQAQHYSLSQLATAANGGTVYTYTAAKGYVGSDEVTLQQVITSTSRGGNCSDNRNYSNEEKTTTYKTIAIRFNVAN